MKEMEPTDTAAITEEVKRTSAEQWDEAAKTMPDIEGRVTKLIEEYRRNPTLAAIRSGALTIDQPPAVQTVFQQVQAICDGIFRKPKTPAKPKERYGLDEPDPDSFRRLMEEERRKRGLS